MAEEFEGEITFIGVSNNDTIEDGERYVDDFDVPYPMAHAPEVWDLFDVPYQPVTIVLGPTGMQELRIDGPVEYGSLREQLITISGT
ncbi:MAG: TlpA family protein disulfide reductase [Actinomycetota bacterium]